MKDLVGMAIVPHVAEANGFSEGYRRSLSRSGSTASPGVLSS